ncbi:MAG TPA: substrate-binding domain-containing protein [Chthonomonadaceae bacterium]|nr:substrate-binding domain-containing protein [Chthonomonadaceae bacterium]
MRIKISAVMLAMVIPLAVAGCGREKQDVSAPPVPTSRPPGAVSPTAGSFAPNAISREALDGVARASKPYKLVLIVKTKNNPFFIPMINAFEETAKELGARAEVQAAPQEDSYEQQAALVQAEASKGAQAILITPASSTSLVAPLKRAQDKGILIVNLDNRLNAATVKAQGLTLGGYVGADNEAGGRLAGEAMVAALNGTGDVAVIEGIRSADNAAARKRGFESAVAGKLKVVDEQTGEWDTEKAHARAQAILAKHPTLAGIFCANDSMAIGAIQAVSEAGKTSKVRVVGYDDIPGVQDDLKSGALTATIEQHPDLMGKYGARLAVAILDGKANKGGEFLVPLETIKGKK